MKQSLHRIYLTFAYGIVVIFMLISAVTATLQTGWGKNKFRNLVLGALLERGVFVSFDDIAGILPFQWKISNLVLQVEGQKITVDFLEFRLSLMRLLKREILFRKLKAENVHYESQIVPEQRLELLTKKQKTIELEVPIAITFRKFQVRNLYFLAKNTEMHFNIDGRLKIDSADKYFLLDTNVERIDFPNSTIRLIARAKKFQPLQIRIDANVATTKVFAPVWEPGFDSHIAFRFYANGTTQAFNTIFFPPDEPVKGSPIRGRFRGNVYSLANQPAEFQKISFKNPWKWDSRFALYGDRSINLEEFYFENPFFTLSASGTTQDFFHPESGSISLYTADLSLFNSLSSLPLSGTIEAEARLNQVDQVTQLNAEVSSSSLSIGNMFFDGFNGTLLLSLPSEDLRGNIHAHTFTLGLPWNLNADIEWPNRKSLLFRNLTIDSPTTQIAGDLSLNNRLHFLGSIEGQFKDLTLLQIVLPNLNASGDAYFTMQFEENEQAFQTASIQVNIFDFLYQELMGQKCSFDLRLEKIFSNPVGLYSFYFEKLSYNRLHFDTLRLLTSTHSENWPYEISGIGYWKAPLEIQSNGYWKYKQNDFLLNIQDFTGNLFGHSFLIPKPFQLEWSKNLFQLSEVELSLADSYLHAQAAISADKADLSLAMDHFPVDFLSLNPLDMGISGFISMDSSITKNKGYLEGNIDAALEDLQIVSLGEDLPVFTSGSFNVALKDERADIKAQLNIKQTQILDCNANFPLEINFFPFQTSINTHKPLRGNFAYKGNVEELLDLFNVGSHRIEGMLDCNLTLSQNLKNPKVTGECTLVDGTYENYYTGTFLENLNADFSANGNIITLNSLKANGPNGGDFSAVGKFYVEPEDHFPFTAHVDFEDLQCAEVSFVSAVARGAVDITGTSQEALAKGRVKIRRVDFTIPEKLPIQVPDLNAQFVNVPKGMKSLLSREIGTRQPYPFRLDLKIDAPENVFITGRGLNSEWKGDFIIGGTMNDIQAKGVLVLDKGEYVFSGRTFILSDGELSFTGKSAEMPYLKLTGVANISNTNIIASLRGPLNRPQLAFQSRPPLPVSSVLSILLFGQDLDNINGIQAVQLAAMVASLSGEGPGALEKTRKSLGVDRLNLVTVPSVEDHETLAIQVGKYITKNVLVSITQGYEGATSDFSVEVDLRNGVIFQAETQQRREQGKFILKWNRNY